MLKPLSLELWALGWGRNPGWRFRLRVRVLRLGVLICRKIKLWGSKLRGCMCRAFQTKDLGKRALVNDAGAC